MSAVSPQPAAQNADRDHALDAARGILMMMGILLHAGNIYSPGSKWLVADSAVHGFFPVMVEWIHFFRMPAFFWISGYFCALTFRRRGARGLMQQRLPRLLIPLLCSWVLLGAVQEWVFAVHDGRALWPALADGIPLYHLWFLVDLIVFVGLAAMLLPALHGRRLGGVVDRVNGSGLIGILLCLAALSVFCNLAVRATGLAYVSLGVTSLGSLATYGPYFAGGVLMYNFGAVRAKFVRAPVWLLVVAPALGTWLLHQTAVLPRWQSEAAQAVRMFLVWAAVAATLRFFYTVFRRESAATRFLSESAYTIYLFHHVFVTALGLALLPHDWPAAVKFILVTLASLLLSTLIHIAVIRRSATARLMFNGKT